MEQVLRNVLLFLSKNKPITKLAQKYGLRLASRFVAGSTLDHAISVSKDLNQNGLCVTLDYLGEFIQSEEEAEETVAHVLTAIQAIHREKVDGHISVKLTSLGIDISEEIVKQHMCTILKEARENDIFINIDMEDYTRYERTIKLVKDLRGTYQMLERLYKLIYIMLKKTWKS